MTTLDSLKNTCKRKKRSLRVGRGQGSGKGETCGRGVKGAGSRSGHRRRYGAEGGQFPLYMKLPIRGFSNAAFRQEYDIVNLRQLEAMMTDGEVVNVETLRKHGFISGKSHGLKILGEGDLTKKVTIEAHAISSGARAKLQKAGILFTLVGATE